MRTILSIASLAVLLTAGTAFAQQPSSTSTDARWQPWLGCWQLADEAVRDQWDVSADDVGKASTPARPARPDTRSRVCVAPSDQARGVTVTTLVADKRVLDETIVADAADHAVSESGCRGSKRSEWSKTGRRVYTRAEIACANQPPRKISSLTMLSHAQWVEVQLVDADGSKHIRVRRYERVPEEAATLKNLPAGESFWTLDDVKEASATLAPEAVQAALVELRAPFALKSKQLLELSDAGVPGGVIDLMLALSYPKRFLVQYPVSTSTPMPGGYFGNVYSPYFSNIEDMWWLGYYSPFNELYWGYYDPRFFRNNLGFVTVWSPEGYWYGGGAPTSGSTGGSGGTSASGEARVINGFGYTRITPRPAEPVTTAGGYSGGGSNGTMSNAGGGSNSGAGVNSSGGYSSGGASSGGDGGRTAVPRPPGGAN